ncbi:MAG: hypothetical protein AUH37_01555 [Candidatus Nitrososphaera sp. 13_1_40CM_48_12]|nr:MAG: hypothetical protein AUH71_04145 [Thaumarchaeota archaeon 13_1_40CM_4_48_7]OLC26023.1 MAG: hypothetical protein AUH37_01555 [Candidatus Nitrososphaera sp. 13_1_40CM_48_12]
MGLITWIIIAVVVLAVIGLGITTFFSGVMKGVEKVEQNPVVKNTTNTASQIVSNATNEAINNSAGKANK